MAIAYYCKSMVILHKPLLRTFYLLYGEIRSLNVYYVLDRIKHFNLDTALCIVNGSLNGFEISCQIGSIITYLWDIWVVFDLTPPFVKMDS